MPQDINMQLATTEVVWKLSDLYKSPTDSQIAKDIAWCKKEAVEIENQYATRIANLTGKELYTLVDRFEKIDITLGRLGTFGFLNFTTQIQNAEAGAFLQKLTELSSEINKSTVFFELEWTKVDDSIATSLLTEEVLSHYRHYLENMRRYASHMLAHVEEKLLIELSPVGASSWRKLFEKVLGFIKFGEKKRTEEEVLSDLYNENRKIRQQAADELTEGLQSQIHILTHIFNTLLADKMISDRLRKYPAWISSMNLHNELEDKTVAILTDTVVSRYDIVQRYYKLKKKLLNLPEIYDYDRYAPLPNLPTTSISWDKCQDIVISAFRSFSPKMAEIASFFFDRNWIHAPIMEGKRAGAFAHPCVPDVHPYILVNYTGNMRDVSTVAHELGHGIHQYLASEKGYYNSSTPLVLAETASVFAELIVFNFQLDILNDKNAKNAFIAQKLESIFATVFRQVSMNRFENKIHNGRRNEGELAQEKLSEFWIETQEEMFKDSVVLTDNYKTWWSYIPHFISSPGYVYSYAFGELLVLALYKIYKEEGSQFVPKYLHLLSQGGCLSPYELLTPFNVNLDEPNFWQGGLEIIDEMLKSIE